MFAGRRLLLEEPERRFQIESGLGFFYQERDQAGYSMNREGNVRW
jgi:hypothetical protein